MEYPKCVMLLPCANRQKHRHIMGAALACHSLPFDSVALTQPSLFHPIAQSKEPD
jgi:hypothetical protein